jgi:hypothetical protein
VSRWSDHEREAFARIADVLIPEAHGMPSASQVALQGDGLDYILDLRPELTEDVRRGLAMTEDLEGEQAVAHLESRDAAALAVIALVATSAYYLVQEVRQRLGYPGQRSRPASPEEEGDYLLDELLQPVVERGVIYRPTPRG